MNAGQSSGESGFQVIVADHLRRYPAMQLEDVYKLAHQSCLGSEHAVADRDDAKRRLEEELARLDEGSEEPMVDPIRPDGRIVRVHLRPLVAGGGDAAQLLEAFVRTANEFEGSNALLKSFWTDVEAMAAAGRVPFAQADAEAYWRRMEALEHAAVRHSAVYRATYRPAYRVVAAEFLPEALRRVSSKGTD
jgi:hypothetical protein